MSTTLSTAPPVATNREVLLHWLKTLRPLKVDIVGDFAGKELFAIHGEVMLAYCIKEAQVDFHTGFQVLHAIHAVETFMNKLTERGCNFHVLWFDDYEHLCVPRHVPHGLAYKYHLTRDILIQHLADPSILHHEKCARSYRFTGLSSDAYLDYLSSNPVHFIMCSHGKSTETESDPASLSHLSIGYRMARKGYIVAFIDDIAFQSSKVHVGITTPTASLGLNDEDDVDFKLPAIDNNEPILDDDSSLGDETPESLSDGSVSEPDDLEPSA